MFQGDDDGSDGSENASTPGERRAVSRRRLLELAGVGAASVGLGGCLSESGEDRETTSAPTDRTADERPAGTETSATPTAPPTRTRPPRTTDEPERTTSGNGPAETDGGPDETGVQDFLWWTMRGYVPAETTELRSTAAAFGDVADRNVNVVTEVITWDTVFQEWTAAITGRSAPDASQMACEQAVTLGYQGRVEPNTELFERYGEWYEAVSEWGRFDGEFWGLPWFTETRSSHVNRDLLEEAGVDSPPDTWSELVETGQTVVEETDASAGWTTPGDRSFLTGQNVAAFTHQSEGALYGTEDDHITVEADAPASLFAHLWTLSLREAWDIAPENWGAHSLSDLTAQYRRAETPIAHLPADLARQLVHPRDGVDPDTPEVAEATELTPMPRGPTGDRRSLMRGSCIASFRDEITEYGAGRDLSMEFIEYMTSPAQIDGHFRTIAPHFLPARRGQTEIPLFTNNPTEIPDSWLDTRLDQVPDAVRYGTSGAGRCAPFLTSLEGATDGYSASIAAMIGNNVDPKSALRRMGNDIRSTIGDHDATDYTLDEKTEGPSLDHAPEAVRPWIEGDGVPQIYNPYD